MLIVHILVKEEEKIYLQTSVESHGFIYIKYHPTTTNTIGTSMSILMMKRRQTTVLDFSARYPL